MEIYSIGVDKEFLITDATEVEAIEYVTDNLLDEGDEITSSQEGIWYLGTIYSLISVAIPAPEDNEHSKQGVLVKVASLETMENMDRVLDWHDGIVTTLEKSFEDSQYSMEQIAHVTGVSVEEVEAILDGGGSVWGFLKVAMALGTDFDGKD